MSQKKYSCKSEQKCLTFNEKGACSARGYIVGDTFLGGGAIGKVFLAEATPERIQQNSRLKLLCQPNTLLKVAIKIIPADLGCHCVQKLSKYVSNEVANMNAVFGEPNVLMLLDVFIECKRIFLVLEYAECGSLKTHYHTKVSRQKRCDGGRWMDEAEVCSIFREIVIGLHGLHTCNIAHRDLKLENVLLMGNGEIKLADFGFSVKLPAWDRDGQNIVEMFRDMLSTTLCGTPAFMAPEVLRCQAGYNAMHADLWSMGIILFIMVNGYYPFPGKTVKEVTKQYERAKVKKIKFREGVSKDASDLIKDLLNRIPSQRPSTYQILQHPFVSKTTEDRIGDGLSASMDEFIQAKTEPIFRFQEKVVRNYLMQRADLLDSCKQSLVRRRVPAAVHHEFGVRIPLLGGDGRRVNEVWRLCARQRDIDNNNQPRDRDSGDSDPGCGATSLRCEWLTPDGADSTLAPDLKRVVTKLPLVNAWRRVRCKRNFYPRTEIEKCLTLCNTVDLSDDGDDGTRHRRAAKRPTHMWVKASGRRAAGASPLSGAHRPIFEDGVRMIVVATACEEPGIALNRVLAAYRPRRQDDGDGELSPIENGVGRAETKNASGKSESASFTFLNVTDVLSASTGLTESRRVLLPSNLVKESQIPVHSSRKQVERIRKRMRTRSEQRQSLPSCAFYKPRGVTTSELKSVDLARALNRDDDGRSMVGRPAPSWVHFKYPERSVVLANRRDQNRSKTRRNLYRENLSTAPSSQSPIALRGSLLKAKYAEEPEGSVRKEGMRTSPPNPLHANQGVKRTMKASRETEVMPRNGRSDSKSSQRSSSSLESFFTRREKQGHAATAESVEWDSPSGTGPSPRIDDSSPIGVVRKNNDVATVVAEDADMARLRRSLASSPGGRNCVDPPVLMWTGLVACPPIVTDRVAPELFSADGAHADIVRLNAIMDEYDFRPRKVDLTDKVPTYAKQPGRCREADCDEMIRRDSTVESSRCFGTFRSESTESVSMQMAGTSVENDGREQHDALVRPNSSPLNSTIISMNLLDMEVEAQNPSLDEAIPDTFSEEHDDGTAITANILPNYSHVTTNGTDDFTQQRGRLTTDSPAANFIDTRIEGEDINQDGDAVHRRELILNLDGLRSDGTQSGANTARSVDRWPISATPRSDISDFARGTLSDMRADLLELSLSSMVGSTNEEPVPGSYPALTDNNNRLMHPGSSSQTACGRFSDNVIDTTDDTCGTNNTAVTAVLSRITSLKEVAKEDCIEDSVVSCIPEQQSYEKDIVGQNRGKDSITLAEKKENLTEQKNIIQNESKAVQSADKIGQLDINQDLQRNIEEVLDLQIHGQTGENAGAKLTLGQPSIFTHGKCLNQIFSNDSISNSHLSGFLSMTIASYNFLDQSSLSGSVGIQGVSINLSRDNCCVNEALSNLSDLRHQELNQNLNGCKSNYPEDYTRNQKLYDENPHANHSRTESGYAGNRPCNYSERTNCAVEHISKKPLQHSHHDENVYKAASSFDSKSLEDSSKRYLQSMENSTYSDIFQKEMHSKLSGQKLECILQNENLYEDAKSFDAKSLDSSSKKYLEGLETCRGQSGLHEDDNFHNDYRWKFSKCSQNSSHKSLDSFLINENKCLENQKNKLDVKKSSHKETVKFIAKGFEDVAERDLPSDVNVTSCKHRNIVRGIEVKLPEKNHYIDVGSTSVGTLSHMGIAVSGERDNLNLGSSTVEMVENSRCLIAKQQSSRCDTNEMYQNGPETDFEASNLQGYFKSDPETSFADMQFHQNSSEKQHTSTSSSFADTKCYENTLDTIKTFTSSNFVDPKNCENLVQQNQTSRSSSSSVVLRIDHEFITQRSDNFVKARAKRRKRRKKLGHSPVMSTEIAPGNEGNSYSEHFADSHAAAVEASLNLENRRFVKEIYHRKPATRKKTILSSTSFSSLDSSAQVACSKSNNKEVSNSTEVRRQKGEPLIDGKMRSNSSSCGRKISNCSLLDLSGCFEKRCGLEQTYYDKQQQMSRKTGKMPSFESVNSMSVCFSLNNQKRDCKEESEINFPMTSIQQKCASSTSLSSVSNQNEKQMAENLQQESLSRNYVQDIKISTFSDSENSLNLCIADYVSEHEKRSKRHMKQHVVPRPLKNARSGRLSSNSSCDTHANSHTMNTPIHYSDLSADDQTCTIYRNVCSPPQENESPISILGTSEMPFTDHPLTISQHNDQNEMGHISGDTEIVAASKSKSNDRRSETATEQNGEPADAIKDKTQSNRPASNNLVSKIRRIVRRSKHKDNISCQQLNAPSSTGNGRYRLENQSLAKVLTEQSESDTSRCSSFSSSERKGVYEGSILFVPRRSHSPINVPKSNSPQLRNSKGQKCQKTCDAVTILVKTNDTSYKPQQQIGSDVTGQQTNKTDERISKVSQPHSNECYTTVIRGFKKQEAGEKSITQQELQPREKYEFENGLCCHRPHQSMEIKSAGVVERIPTSTSNMLILTTDEDSLPREAPEDTKGDIVWDRRSNKVLVTDNNIMEKFIHVEQTADPFVPDFKESKLNDARCKIDPHNAPSGVEASNDVNTIDSVVIDDTDSVLPSKTNSETSSRSGNFTAVSHSCAGLPLLKDAQSIVQQESTTAARNTDLSPSPKQLQQGYAAKETNKRTSIDATSRKNRDVSTELSSNDILRVAYKTLQGNQCLALKNNNFIDAKSTHSIKIPNSEFHETTSSASYLSNFDVEETHSHYREKNENEASAAYLYKKTGASFSPKQRAFDQKVTQQLKSRTEHEKCHYECFNPSDVSSSGTVQDIQSVHLNRTSDVYFDKSVVNDRQWSSDCNILATSRCTTNNEAVFSKSSEEIESDDIVIVERSENADQWIRTVFTSNAANNNNKPFNVESGDNSGVTSTNSKSITHKRDTNNSNNFIVTGDHTSRQPQNKRVSRKLQTKKQVKKVLRDTSPPHCEESNLKEYVSSNSNRHISCRTCRDGIHATNVVNMKLIDFVLGELKKENSKRTKKRNHRVLPVMETRSTQVNKSLIELSTMFANKNMVDKSVGLFSYTYDTVGVQTSQIATSSDTDDSVETVQSTVNKTISSQLEMIDDVKEQETTDNTFSKSTSTTCVDQFTQTYSTDNAVIDKNQKNETCHQKQQTIKTALNFDIECSGTANRNQSNFGSDAFYQPNACHGPSSFSPTLPVNDRSQPPEWLNPFNTKRKYDDLATQTTEELVNSLKAKKEQIYSRLRLLGFVPAFQRIPEQQIAAKPEISSVQLQNLGDGVSHVHLHVPAGVTVQSSKSGKSTTTIKITADDEKTAVAKQKTQQQGPNLLETLLAEADNSIIQSRCQRELGNALPLPLSDFDENIKSASMFQPARATEHNTERTDRTDSTGYTSLDYTFDFKKRIIRELEMAVDKPLNDDNESCQSLDALEKRMCHLADVVCRIKRVQDEFKRAHDKKTCHAGGGGDGVGVSRDYQEACSISPRTGNKMVTPSKSPRRPHRSISPHMMTLKSEKTAKDNLKRKVVKPNHTRMDYATHKPKRATKRKSKRKKS